ncbi:MAG TPA: hypothetical protein VK508_19910 [Cyclobacteriaceae bacterium]|nr:hypothetical protein [Cyclobacteriaceae bacterium]
MALRNFFAVIFLSLSLQAFSQTFEGGFVRQEAGTGNCEAYYFWKDGQFSWFRINGNEKALGNGNYSIKDGSIELAFAQARRQFDLQAESAIPTKENRSVVKVNAMRSTGVPFPGLRFVLNESRLIGETDRSGTATVTIDNPPAKDNIHFEVDGYGTYDTRIQLRGVNIFYAFVIDDAIRYRENTVAKFKFIYSRRKLDLMDATGTHSFKKTSRKKFMDTYHKS